MVNVVDLCCVPKKLRIKVSLSFPVIHIFVAYFCFDIVLKSRILQKTGRIYKVGSNFFEIQHSVINQFMQWNINFPENKEIDKRMVHALLLILLTKEELANFDVPVCGVLFIQGSFHSKIIKKNNSFKHRYRYICKNYFLSFIEIISHRSKANIERIGAVHGYIREFCQSKQAENSNEKPVES